MFVKQQAQWLNISLKIFISVMFAGRMFETPSLKDVLLTRVKYGFRHNSENTYSHIIFKTVSSNVIGFIFDMDMIGKTVRIHHF